ncbi:uncharacterized protein LOC116406303 [Cucumis sativus]|uniref:uncharacterized protein LOC116406303 n=1 Tax=Cucumis sativus TaxID=3659 RepID=UPI0012F49C62|nr:uncharacterized protein LOC116406303 [Cucumis sativus]
MDDEEMEEFNSNKDFDIEYDPLVAAIAAAAGSDDVGDENISIVQSKSFVFTQGWDSEMIVDYRINEEEFHKISFMHCHFFIRKSSDSNSDVYDFREMYVTPPDTDVYVVPKVLAPSNASKEPPIDAPRDPLYKSEKEVLKVFLTKHFKNRRLWDPEFILDFEKIYVIDSKTKSITRAKVLRLEDIAKKADGIEVVFGRLDGLPIQELLTRVDALKSRVMRTGNVTYERGDS